MRHGMIPSLRGSTYLERLGRRPQRQCLRRRTFCSSPIAFSGHSRWSKIKHDKGANDAAKSKQRSVLSKTISTAVKQLGPDPAYNPPLVQAINAAKKAGFAKSSIEAAILKGQGKSASGSALESVIIEAMLPSQVACVIDCATDNKARLLTDIRSIVTKQGGNITSTAFLFDRKGRVVFEKKEGLGVDDILEPAIEAGATDVTMDEDGKIMIDTEMADVNTVAQTLSHSMGLAVESADIIYDPKEEMMVDVDESVAGKVERILELLKEDTSVQDVFLNAR